MNFILLKLVSMVNAFMEWFLELSRPKQKAIVLPTTFLIVFGFIFTIAYLIAFVLGD